MTERRTDAEAVRLHDRMPGTHVKIISFINFKGGAGKTTALSVVASALLARGRRVALFESDENAPLGSWRANARRAGTWDETCEIFPAGDLAVFERSAGAAEKAGFEFALVDTHGGGSELNSTVVASSTLAIVPTAITSYDVTASVTTVEFIVDLLEREELGQSVIIALLVTKLPHTLNKSREGDLRSIQDFPLFQTMLRCSATTLLSGADNHVGRRLRSEVGRSPAVDRSRRRDRLPRG